MKGRMCIGVAIAVLVGCGVTVRADVSAQRCDGKPAFKEGKALGYFVWKDGDTWKLRWMTFGEKHEFRGRVEVVGGQLASFKRIDMDEKHRVVAPGRRGHVVRGPRGRVVGVTPGRGPVVASKDEDHIEQADENTLRFLTHTDDDSDGVDFKVSPSATRLRLVLQIDGEERPREVEVGRHNFTPNEAPLVIDLK